ncbi:MULTISPECIES: ArsR/SmtB family transcription factor [Bacillaceae]|jgi:DNA-binding transcriptional ArsR family regulator|uniref:ArsR/SmtB family transcription factor n=1 Tax=Bacillaceae TaxID=186817 RepID=UPI00101C07FF|nr:metalloregulator ArsR/SmtB family transcription factor [Ectobacillus funiculus]
MYMQIERFNDGAEVLKVLAHPTRIALVNFMIEKGPVNVTTLYEAFGMPQSTISQHLSRLKSVKIVSGTRRGLEIYYEVKDKRVENILNAVVSA